MIIDELVKLGDENFLTTEQIFCFGDRQTRKSTNMVLRTLIKFFKSSEKEFNITIIAPTLDQGKILLDRFKSFADRFQWDTAVLTRRKIVIEIEKRILTANVFTTAESQRGYRTNFIMIDEAPFLRNHQHLFRSLFVSGADFVIGGASFYKNAINPNIYNKDTLDIMLKIK